MSTPDRLGGIIHTYQKFDPVHFPSPTAPPPDLVSPAFGHLLFYGSTRKLTAEVLARAVRIDPQPDQGPGGEPGGPPGDPARAQGARSSKLRDRPGSASPTTAPWSPAPASAGCALGEAAGGAARQRPGAPVRVVAGKLELDMMGSHQMSERQVIEAIQADAIKTVFESTWTGTAWRRSWTSSARASRSRSATCCRRSFTPNAAARCPRRGRRRSRSTPARMSGAGPCMEFVLAGLYATTDFRGRRSTGGSRTRKVIKAVKPGARGVRLGNDARVRHQYYDAGLAGIRAKDGH